MNFTKIHLLDYSKVDNGTLCGKNIEEKWQDSECYVSLEFYVTVKYSEIRLLNHEKFCKECEENPRISLLLLESSGI